ncbi:MAG TPA: site-specific integrase [Thermoleophilia bacterium]|nr:site-specific integrase [Thermoleophilia bacterium]
MPKDTYTLGEAFEYFRAQSNLSPRTLETYAYAFQHFLAFLEHSKNAVLLSVAGPSAADRALNALGGQAQDVNLLAWFVNYLGQEVERAHADRSATRARDRRLEPATVRLYAQAVITWFGFLADELLLPDRFPTAAAIARANRRLRTYVPRTMARESAPEPPEGMEALLRAFDSPQIDNSLPTKEQHRLKLEALRNRALIYALADSGARVSEVLRLTADEVRGARLNRAGIWSVEVRGKGRGKHGRMVTLRFTSPTLSALREYLKARQDPGATSLFVSHAKTRPEARGQPLSANAAWRVVQKAANELGLTHIHPHDFRHWRATQMLREGIPLDQVQRFLNHRSIRTTQLYAKTAERQVDEAGARTSPLAR